jgi:Ca-activated chloride channel family protein
MATRWQRFALAAGLTCALAAGCGDDDSGDAAQGPGSTGIGQGGAQDFGAFRALLDVGEIPGPDTLDSVGFFNEHKIELPPAECGHDVCVHGLLGVMGNMISGANCTMVMIGLNSPLDPASIERPPLNLALAIDTSGSMAGAPIARVREGLLRMLDALQPEDHVSLVAFSDRARVIADGDSGDFRTFAAAIEELHAAGSTNIYDGLRSAYELVERDFDAERQNRVILLSDGEATAGVLQSARIAELGRAYAEQGIGLSTIGLGVEFDPALLRTLAEAGAGTFHFVEDAAAVREVFSEEVQLVVVPIAQRGTLELRVAEGYELRALYGTRLSNLDPTSAWIELPTLHIAHRQSADDVEGGRRGGGGVIIAELVPAGDSPADVGSIELAYDDPRSGERVSQEALVSSPEIDDDTLEGGYFGGPGVEKAFVALNVYAGFEIAATAAAGGDYGTAIATLEALADNASEWLDANPDPDIEDDLEYVDRFIELLERQEVLARPAQPPNPWPRD